MKEVKIVGRIKRKPDHFYYIDGLGSIVEVESPNTKHTIWERIQMKWIDWFYR